LSNILIVLSSSRFPSRHDKQHFSGQVTTHERTRLGYAKTTGRLFHLYASFQTTNELSFGLICLHGDPALFPYMPREALSILGFPYAKPLHATL
jgi:hypothetical protein